MCRHPQRLNKLYAGTEEHQWGGECAGGEVSHGSKNTEDSCCEVGLRQNPLRRKEGEPGLVRGGDVSLIGTEGGSPTASRAS